MRLGICSFSHQLPEKIRIVSADKYINHIELAVDSIRDAEVLRDIYSELELNNISVGIHLPLEMNVCAIREKDRRSWRDLVFEVAEILKDCKIEYYNMHCGFSRDSEAISRGRACLEEILKGNRDIRITLENMYDQGIDNIGITPEEITGLLDIKDKSLERRLGFCYDTGHARISAGDYSGPIGDRLILAHYSFNDGKKDLHMGLDSENPESIGIFRGLLEMSPEIIVLEIRDELLEDSLKNHSEVLEDSLTN